MKGLLMFPVLVLFMLTLIAAPTMFESSSGYDITRNVSPSQMNTVRSYVMDLQDEYGFSEWYGIGGLGWIKYQENYDTEHAGVVTLLNTVYPTPMNASIITMHGLIADEIMQLVLELGNPATTGRYVTQEEIYAVLDVSVHLSSSVTYEEYLQFSREVDENQLDNVYDAIKGYQDKYGDDNETTRWLTWNVGNAGRTIVDGVVHLLQTQFDEEYDEATLSVHYIMARVINEMIYDAGDPDGDGAYLTKVEVFNVIKLDPQFAQEFEALETGGMKLSTTTFFIAVLAGILGIAFISGIRIVGFGLSDTAVHMITNYSVYILLWSILSLMSASLILATPLFGIPIYAGLTLSYIMGVMAQVNGGSD